MLQGRFVLAKYSVFFHGVAAIHQQDLAQALHSSVSVAGQHLAAQGAVLLLRQQVFVVFKAD